MCGVPSIVSRLPQMEQIMEKYDVGRAVDISDTDKIITTLSAMQQAEVYKSMVDNCKIASKELNWETEVLSLLQIIHDWN